jgi:methylglutaconyl-CoA hydratase
VFEQVIYEIKNRVAFLTLNRPDKRNALTPVLIAELRTALDLAEKDAAVKVIVIQATGKGFCAGLDLDELKKISAMSPLQNLEDSRHLMELFKKIYTLQKLVIAKVQGLAIAGGCGLATVCDIIVSDRENAKYCYSETKIGFIPAIVSVLILRRTRNAGIREMLLRANMISSDEALRLGMITHSVPSSELDAATLAIAKDICETTSPASVALTKQLLWSAETMNLEDAMNFAVSLNALSRTTDDLKKGVSAFLNKEKHTW